MSDREVDWRELATMPMHVEVSTCGGCPMSYEGDCLHPNAPKGLDTDDTRQAPPDACPLRKGSLTIHLSRAVRR